MDGETDKHIVSELLTGDLESLSPEQLLVLSEHLLKEVNHLREVITNLKNQQDQASENESKYTSLFEMSDDAILVIDKEQFVDCNQAVVKMLGYKNKTEVLNTHPSELSPEFQPDGRRSFEKAEEMMQLAMTKGSHHFEWVHTRANGEDFPVEVWLSKVEFGDKILINTIWRDLTEKKKAEALILKNIREKEILLKEIHHRVKNNLQIISSLLNLQAANTKDNQAQKVLHQSKTRVESMARIHQMLYGAEDLYNIDYGEYLRGLISELIDPMSNDEDKITLDLKADNVRLNINTAVPLGLLINEFVTNSIKYAFPENKGRIYLHLQFITPTTLLLNYGDDGIGYPEEFNFDDANSLGFQLISSLSEQLGTTINRISHKQGTHYKMTVTLQ